MEFVTKLLGVIFVSACVLHVQPISDKFQVAFFWVLICCNDVVGYQCFGVWCCFHLQSEVKLEIVWFSETLLSYYIITRRRNQEDRDFNLHHYEDLTPHSRHVYASVLTMSH